MGCEPPSAPPLKLGQPILLDGPTWVVGRSGVGKPFAVRVVVENTSARALTVWAPRGPEGRSSYVVELRGGAGTVSLESPPQPATGGLQVETLAPKSTVAFDFELLRMAGKAQLPLGQVELRLRYANSLASEQTDKPVWRGEALSPWVKVKLQDLPPNVHWGK